MENLLTGTWKEILLTGDWVKTLLAGTLPTGGLDVNPVDRRPRLKPCQQRDRMETLLTGGPDGNPTERGPG